MSEEDVDKMVFSTPFFGGYKKLEGKSNIYINILHINNDIVEAKQNVFPTD